MSKVSTEYIIAKATFTYDVGQGPANGEFDGPLYTHVTPVYELCLVRNGDRRTLHNRLATIYCANTPNYGAI